jgi:hypothetical protein
MRNQDEIIVEIDSIEYSVNFSFEKGSYGNGYDEAPYGPVVDINVIEDVETGKIVNDMDIEQICEEETYDYINEYY